MFVQQEFSSSKISHMKEKGPDILTGKYLKEISKKKNFAGAEIQAFDLPTCFNILFFPVTVPYSCLGLFLYQQG